MDEPGAFGLVLELGKGDKKKPSDDDEGPASERVPAGLESAAAVLRDALNNGSAADVARAFMRCQSCCGGEGYSKEE